MGLVQGFSVVRSRCRRRRWGPSPWIAVVLGLCLAAAGAAPSVWAQEAPPAADTTDSDTPDTVSKGSWLPIPIFITEPAIGIGLGAALGYIHPRAEEAGTLSTVATPQSVGGTGSGRKRPPDISGVAAGYTDNDTWAAGVGHSASWRRDRIRYVGAAAYADINASLYPADRELGFNLEGTFLFQDVKLRLGSSDFFLGGKLFALDTETAFRIQAPSEPPLPHWEGDYQDVGLAVQGYFDARDNTFTPNRGQLFTLDVWRYDEALGGDFSYWRANLEAQSFHQLHPRFVLGLRLDASAASGDPPFWGFPWITLRGVPAMRYQNELVGVVEIEGRWNVLRRWALVGFFGKGATAGDTVVFEDANDVDAIGAGVRYLYLPDLDLWVGADVAWGPEDTAWYIQVGHAW
jgi:opacity protein-like surface antigen